MGLSLSQLEAQIIKDFKNCETKEQAEWFWNYLDRRAINSHEVEMIDKYYNERLNEIKKGGSYNGRP